MNLHNVKERLVAGQIKVSRAGSGFAINVKRYDPLTGAELPSEEIGTDLTQLENEITERQEALDGLKEILSQAKGLAV